MHESLTRVTCQFEYTRRWGSLWKAPARITNGSCLAQVLTLFIFQTMGFRPLPLATEQHQEDLSRMERVSDED
jgi:hypothetical protein